MGASKHDNKLKVEEESEKGTALSVTLVGAVILITYLVLFGLYMGRV
ncbi:cytochrome c oxidase subunit 2A [Bacillus sp. FJAT-29937]|nr:cytochrome c oxidase subunit 2A [Bacillus sp. FJAT-29937]